MLAHLQGQMFNASQLGQSLGGASHTTAKRYLDVLVDTMMVRRLPPHLPNMGRRLVKSPKVYRLSSHRTAAGTEIDLVIEHRARKIGVEVKFSSAPKPAKGFWQALQDLQPDRAYVIAPVPRRYPLAGGVEVLPVSEIATLLR